MRADGTNRGQVTIGEMHKKRIGLDFGGNQPNFTVNMHLSRQIYISVCAPVQAWRTSLAYSLGNHNLKMATEEYDRRFEIEIHIIFFK